MPDDVRVRMYNVGFGDAFLIEVPTGDDRPFRILVDCGAHSAGYPSEGWRPEDVVDQIIADITGHDGGPHLDLVVATHRHQDHVSGFRAAAWANVHVGEVWLPWTEDANDPEATGLRDRQHRLALGMRSALRRPEVIARFADPQRLDSLRELVANSLTNEDAMATLRSGFRGRARRRFLGAGDPPLSPPSCPGLTVHVLGPSRDPQVIREMDPPAGQSYLRYMEEAAPTEPTSETLLESTQAARLATHRPFQRTFTLTADSYLKHWPHLALDDDIKDAAAGIMRDDDLAAAVSLDKAVNNTSLMLMFEIGDAFLLFPGDAQWGSWQAALEDPESRDLLSRTTFYKIGHHGSHNATPRAFVEDVLAGRTLWGAVASVRPIDRWPQIPKQELLTALHRRATRVVRSDAPGRVGDGVNPRHNVGIDFTVPQQG